MVAVAGGGAGLATMELPVAEQRGSQLRVRVRPLARKRWNLSKGLGAMVWFVGTDVVVVYVELLGRC